MISELVKSRAHTWRGVPHYPVNVCLHCGEEDDPEGYWGEDKDGDRVCGKCEKAEDEVCDDIDSVITQLVAPQMTFERIKTAIADAYKVAPWGSPLEIHYFDALCEMVLIEREMKEAVTCPRHRPERRFPGGLCQDCSTEMYQAA